MAATEIKAESTVADEAVELEGKVKLLVPTPEGGAEEFVVLDEEGNTANEDSKAKVLDTKSAGDDAENGEPSVPTEGNVEVKTEKINHESKTASDCSIQKSDTSEKNGESKTVSVKKSDTPEKKSPKRVVPDLEERLREVKKINLLTREALKDANETVMEYKTNMTILEQRIKQQEQELQRLRNSEKSSEKVEGEIAEVKKMAELKAARAAEMEKNLRMMREDQEETMHENIQMRDKVESLKKKCAQLDSDKSACRRRIKELEDKIESLVKKNRQLMDANDEYKSYTEDLKTRNALQEKKIERLTKQGDGKRSTRTEGAADDWANLPAPKRSKIETTTTHSSKRESVEKTERPCSQETETGRFSSYSYEHKKRTPSVEQDQENVAKIGIIGDANVRFIMPYLHSTSNKEWVAITGMQTVDDLENAVDSKSTFGIFDKLIEQDQIIIMLGTNNIRRGEDGYNIAHRLQEVARTITMKTATQVKISEIPPTDIGNTDKVIGEVVKVNEKIRSEPKHALSLKRLEPFTLKEILREDGKGFHLTDNAAAHIAKDFDEQAMPNSVVSTAKKTVLEMEYSKVGLVVGRRGMKRQALQDQFQVRIICDNERVIIRGEAENRRRAVAEIKKIVKGYNAGSSSRSYNSNDYNSADYQDYYYDRNYDYYYKY